MFCFFFFFFCQSTTVCLFTQCCKENAYTIKPAGKLMHSQTKYTLSPCMHIAHNQMAGTEKRECYPTQEYISGETEANDEKTLKRRKVCQINGPEVLYNSLN
uniref:Putative secreted protein ovary overexpressed n=1 Tax=Rhipicephalus microplus TaxID=6941 RepID=A0A6M2D9V7_RHIMP